MNRWELINENVMYFVASYSRIKVTGCHFIIFELVFVK